MRRPHPGASYAERFQISTVSLLPIRAPPVGAGVEVGFFLASLHRVRRALQRASRRSATTTDEGRIAAPCQPAEAILVV
jgi:hypothetical protein